LHHAGEDIQRLLDLYLHQAVGRTAAEMSAWMLRVVSRIVEIDADKWVWKLSECKESVHEIEHLPKQSKSKSTKSISSLKNKNLESSS
jgi:hypothetical protein